jgi:hypothetical protein
VPALVLEGNAMLQLVQLAHQSWGRRIAVVQEPYLRLITGFDSIYSAAQAAIASQQKLHKLLTSQPPAESLDYDAVYHGRSLWKLLPSFDHPADPAHCFIMGTGLTHKASAQMRQNMHNLSPSPLVGEGRGEGENVQHRTGADSKEPLTDSMKMYNIGLEGGRPNPNCIGSSPEWFYKGTGAILRAHNEPLDVPSHGLDGGEEAEIAGCYILSPDGTPYRVGLTQGNEFSDHIMESQNYLYLAQSKLRSCSIGPELIINPDFSDVPGTTKILRKDKTLWQGKLASGEKWMCHTLANLEHHHFKHATHRTPGDVHIHFLGADEFSFKDKLKLEDGDIMQLEFKSFGRPLRNPIRIDRSPQAFVPVKEL